MSFLKRTRGGVEKCGTFSLLGCLNLKKAAFVFRVSLSGAMRRYDRGLAHQLSKLQQRFKLQPHAFWLMHFAIVTVSLDPLRHALANKPSEGTFLLLLLSLG